MTNERPARAESCPGPAPGRPGASASTAQPGNAPTASATRALRRIKLIHTTIWALFAGCTLAIIPFAWTDHYRYAAMMSAIVLVEVLILLFNGWRCPLTAVAGRYTDDRQDNFDIYLPLWLAKHNKTIFGVAYIAGVLLTLSRWAASSL